MIYFLLATFLGVVPIAFWLIFFLWQDIRKPEPTRWLLILFFLGMAITPVVWFGENAFLKLLQIKNVNNIAFSLSLVVYGMVAVIEELAKFFSAKLVLRGDRYFDEAIDAMIYLIVLALGFGTVENILVSYNWLNNGGILPSIFPVLALRFVGANLIHALCSGIAGYGWALSLLKKQKKPLYWGLFFAIILHWIFNVAIINWGGEAVYLITFVLFGATIFLLWVFDSLKHIRKSIVYY